MTLAAISHWWSGFYPRPPSTVWVPAVLVSGAMALPLVYLVLRSLGADANIWDILWREQTAAILSRSALLVAAVTLGCIAIAVPTAWLTVRTDLPLRRVWSVLTALPLVIPSFIGGFVVVAALSPKGMLQGLLETLFGVQRIPDIHGFWGAAFTLTLLSYPYVLLPVRGAIKGLDPRAEETARGLGYNGWETFRHVTWPLLRPAVAVGSLLVALYTLSDFGAVSLLQYETFTWAIYIQFESAFDRDVSAGLSLVLVAIALFFLIGEGRTRSSSQYFLSGTGGPKPAGAIALGRWKWPALGFCSSIVLLSLAAPLGTLLYWVVRGVQAGESLSPVWGAAANSLYVSSLAAVACVLLGLPIAILSVRYPGRFAVLIERISYMGFALPGVVVALALVFFGANYAPAFYQTVVLLLFAYVVLFLPPAVGAVRASLLQVNPRVEEASRGLGLSPLRTLRHVTLPLVQPGLLAGAALVFLITMKELPATLILGPIGFKTLATSIWGSAEAAFFAEAAFPALLLIILSSVPMGILILRETRQ